MSKENIKKLKKELDKLGVSYDGRWNEDKLAEILEVAKEADLETLDAKLDEILEPIPVGIPPSPKEPERTEEEIKNIADSVSGKDKLTTDELTEAVGLHKEFGGEVKTKSGIILPPTAIAVLEKTQYVWIVKEEPETCLIYKVNKARRETFVREYSLAEFGENYRQITASFVDKRNRLGK